MDKIFWLIFVICAAVNMTACATAAPRLRRFSKVLLMPLLFGAYALSARDFLRPVAAALFFGWLGDIFLLHKDDQRMLAAGMGAFGTGHIFYFYAIFRHFSPAPPLWALAAVPFLFLCLAVGSIVYLYRGIPKKMRAPSFLYALLLSSVAALAVIALISGAPGGIPLAAGTLLFLVSDSILSLETFRLGNSAAADFAVMLTYIAAQALLIFAFAL